jgi:hypothetical protein
MVVIESRDLQTQRRTSGPDTDQGEARVLQTQRRTSSPDTDQREARVLSEF